MSKKHYPYSPSGTARWLACPGSVTPGQEYQGEDKESVYAAEGTRAHAVCEAMLKDEPYQADDSEMEEAATDYKKVVDRIRNEPGFTAEWIEQIRESDLPDLGGTVDYVALVITPGLRTLKFVDFKYGAGEPVTAINNLQLLTYAVIWQHVLKTSIDEFEFNIVQPRSPVGDTESTWRTNRQRVRQHRDAILTAMGQNRLQTGAHCRWCPKLSTCTKFREELDEIANLKFDSADDFPPEEVEEWLRLHELGPSINIMLEIIKDRLIAADEMGVNLPGHRVTSRKNRRTWDKDKDCETLLAKKYGKAKVTENKLLTPAALVKKVPEAVETVEALSSYTISKQIKKVDTTWQT